MPIGIYIRTKEHKKKISDGLRRIGAGKWNIGKKASIQTKNKMSLMRKGNPKSEEWKEKIGKAHLGKKRPPFSKEWKDKISESMKKNGWHPPSNFGKKHSEKTKKKISKAHLKRVYVRITPLNHRIRTSKEYKLWRQVVKERDNFACIWCGSTKSIEADHIKPFALFPELRFAIDNGRTLCKECHKTTENYARKGISRYG